MAANASHVVSLLVFTRASRMAVWLFSRIHEREGNNKWQTPEKCDERVSEPEPINQEGDEESHRHTDESAYDRSADSPLIYAQLEIRVAPGVPRPNIDAPNVNEKIQASR